MLCNRPRAPKKQNRINSYTLARIINPLAGKSRGGLLNPKRVYMLHISFISLYVYYCVRDLKQRIKALAIMLAYIEAASLCRSSERCTWCWSLFLSRCTVYIYIYIGIYTWTRTIRSLFFSVLSISPYWLIAVALFCCRQCMYIYRGCARARVSQAKGNF